MKTKINISTILTTLAIAGAVVFSSCKKNETPASGTYNMYLTDAPACYQQVNVNITGAEIYCQSGGWMPLTVKTGVYNLLNFSNGKDTLLATNLVSPGAVTQIRLLLGSKGNSVMLNNELYPLLLSGSMQQELTVSTSTNVQAGYGTTNVIVDFDAGRSITAVGNNTYTLNPVLRVSDVSCSGCINGSISPSSTQYMITAVASTDTLGTYSSFVSGGFAVQNLKSGTYNVTVWAQKPYTITGVQVTSGHTTSIGTITLE